MHWTGHWPERFEVQRGIGGFDEIAGRTRRDMITASDVAVINQFMGARTAYARWEPILNKRRRWIQELDPRLDLIATGDRNWRSREGDRLVHRALAGILGPGRNIAVATKVLHLKWPRLFPILDRFVVELLGGRFSAEADERAQDAAELILHMRQEARRNLPVLRTVQVGLRADGRTLSLVRVLDSILWAAHPAANSEALAGRVIACRLAR